MADIVLEKPKAGEHITVNAQAGSRFVIQFDTSQATPSKDGASFIFTFDDGARITITNFYGTESSEASPLFYLPQDVLPYEDFFARMDDHISGSDTLLLHANIPLRTAHLEPQALSPTLAADPEDELIMKEKTFTPDAMAAAESFDELSALQEGDLHIEYGNDDIFFDSSYTFLHDEDTFAEAEDLFSLENSDLTATRPHAEAGEDMVFMDFDGIFVDDAAYDEPLQHSTDDLDVLLGTKNSLSSVKDMFSHSQDGHMEMAVIGDNLPGENVQDVLYEVGITKNTDGSISLSQGWHAQNTNASFTEYTHSESDTTLIVHQTLIVNGV